MAGILRCGTVCGFKNSNTCIVVDIRSRGNSDPANTGSQGVRDVISVQVQCGDHIILSRASEDLLKEGICNHILDNRSEEHTSELQSRGHLVCRLLLEKKRT